MLSASKRPSKAVVLLGVRLAVTTLLPDFRPGPPRRQIALDCELIAG